MITRPILLALLATATAVANAQATPSKWPTQDGAYDIANFHFKDGETITIEPWRAKAFPVVKDLMGQFMG